MRFRLPKSARENALAQHDLFMELAMGFFSRMPQLILLPSGKRIKWTKAGEDRQFDMPWGFWQSDAKFVKNAIQGVQHVIVEQQYETAKRRFDSYLQGEAFKENQRHARGTVATGY